MRFLTATLVTAAIALAGCTSDRTPTPTGDSGNSGSFIHNLFESSSEGQLPVPHNEVPSVPHNETPVEPLPPNTKSVTSKIKQPAVPVAPPPKQHATAEPQTPAESAAPPALSGAVPILSTGRFENRAGSPR